MPMSDEIHASPLVPLPQPSRSRWTWPVAAAAFVLGLGAAGGLGWYSGADFARLFSFPHRAGMAPAMPQVSALQSEVPVQMAPSPGENALSLRIAALAQRLDRLDQRAEAAAGNVEHTETLLLAFAARRALEHGAPLGALGDQLKLRFGAAQPAAVATLIAGGKDLVPISQLAARLDAMEPALTTAPGRQTMWGRIAREVSELFVIRRDWALPSDAAAQFGDARLALSQGRIDDAIAQVQHLSAGRDTAAWVAAARRTRDVERALDAIDMAAVVDPRPLKDAPTRQSAADTPNV
jgi:hypothetical protein